MLCDPTPDYSGDSTRVTFFHSFLLKGLFVSVFFFFFNVAPAPNPFRVFFSRPSLSRTTAAETDVGESSPGRHVTSGPDTETRRKSLRKTAKAFSDGLLKKKKKKIFRSGCTIIIYT